MTSQNDKNDPPISKVMALYWLSAGGILIVYWLGSWTGTKIGASIGFAGALGLLLALISVMFYWGLKAGRKGK